MSAPSFAARFIESGRCALLAMTAFASAAAAQAPPVAMPSDGDVSELTLELQQLGGSAVEEIHGVDGVYTWPLGIRLDQAVTAASLDLRYIGSPALLPALSHLKLRLNGETLATLPLPGEPGGSEQRRQLVLDPGYFSDYNQLTLQLIGHYTTGCEDPLNSALWASISGRSRLRLQLRRLPLQPDLALLPVPFFDPRDTQRLVLPFVFASGRTLGTLEAAGVLASWFGALADYRGAEFPVSIDQLPPRQHAVVFATNTQTPAGLSLTPVQQPTLRVLAHPDGSAARLLLLQGRDEAQLKTAASALASNQNAFAGAHSIIERFEEAPPRAPYDAPRWMRSNAPTRLGSLVSDPAQLQAKGHAPAPITIGLRLPPDLFLWNRKGLPLHLIYRYTSPVEDDNSLLSASVNGQLLRAFRLEPIDSADTLLDSGDARQQRQLMIPPFQLGSVNQLQLRFAIDYHRPGPCRDAGIDLVRASIDPDSTIDLSGVPHYAELPNLELFANAGFPFTRRADLGDSALVLPDPETADDIEAALAIMAHMGRATGVAATRATWVRIDNIQSVADRDLIIIGGGIGGRLLKDWGKSLPFVIDSMRHQLSPLSRLADYADSVWRREPDRGAGSGSAAWRLAAQGEGPLAAFVGFESPLKRGRSAIAMLATSRDNQQLAWRALLQPASVARMHGDVVILRDSQIESYDSGARYAVGRLPPWSRVWWALSQHPLLLVVAALLAALLAAVLARWALRGISRRRLGRG